MMFYKFLRNFYGLIEILKLAKGNNQQLSLCNVYCWLEMIIRLRQLILLFLSTVCSGDQQLLNFVRTERAVAYVSLL